MEHAQVVFSPQGELSPLSRREMHFSFDELKMAKQSLTLALA